MRTLTKMIHVLSLGLWFGTMAFFTFVVGLSLFSAFEGLSAKPAGERPFWYPVPPELEKAPPSARFPDPLRKEQGSRTAGEAVSRIFPTYYGIQLGAGALSLITALAWLSLGKVHRVRALLLALALAGAGLGWWMEQKVSALRVQRNQASDVVLTSASPGADALQIADEARAEFGRWHTYSLITDLATLLLVTSAMALAARLPDREEGLPPAAA